MILIIQDATQIIIIIIIIIIAVITIIIMVRLKECRIIIMTQTMILR